jgi:hypothetical protein
MNLNKFTKAELITKLKQIKSNNSKLTQNSILIKINSYFSQIWELIITFKNILIKLTLISFFIQIFKKYKIFRRLWKLLNSIVMTIFGISFLENFGMEYIQHLFYEIRFLIGNTVDYFTNTHFYKYLSDLFTENKTNPSSETINEMSSMTKEISGATKGSEENIKKSGGNSKIVEWIKPENEYSEINEDIKTDNSTYKNIFYIGTFIIISSLAWYYSDEVKSSFSSVMEWILSFRPGPSDDPGGNNNNNPRSVGGNIPREGALEPEIEIIDRTKNNNSSTTLENPTENSKKLFTSPSIENLTEEAKKYWKEYSENRKGESSNSPDSDESDSSNSSTETIKPPIYSNLEGSGSSSSQESTPSESSSSQLSDTDTDQLIKTAIVNRLRNEWKSMIPKAIGEKIKYIENNINEINNEINNDGQLKRRIILNLSEIEVEQWKFNNYVSSLKKQQLVEPNVIFQAELQLELINDWIREYHNKLIDLRSV